ncbi:TBP-associated factor II 15 [Prunus dulcis]|uniref:TBP-associated factor II 15 n=1 Tax=Prunus dulcis TaxID=3755 RepID=A0A5H2XKG1_PRUDU|nr:TBP-associated factor II 15 [Prunus dulcis]
MRTYNGCTQERELLVLGGNGFVGSHVCREALDRGLSVASLSRSGRSSLHDPWASNVTWHKGNLLSPESLKDALDGVTSVISCVGGFGSNSYMYKINGTANINAIRAASEQGVKRFVYVSAADFGVRAAETELLTKFPYGGVILRPGFIYGTRSVGSVKLPLGVIGSPLEMRYSQLFQHTRPLNQLPLVGPLFTPPVNVTAVANVAVRAATDPVFPPGIVDVYGIQRYNQKSNTARVSNQYRISEREKMNHNQNQNQNQQSSEGSRHDDDAALTEFLASLMDYTPTIPDELVEHYLAKSGFQCPDVRLIRLVAVATQKFVSEVATDALQQCKARQASVVKDKRDKQQKDKRLILTMEDLSRALREYGVNVKHQEYFADSPSTGLDPASREE